tara:strand:- start:160 stop:444 length:285 start_codon:yes stop_codon:yes gene_type:complete
MPRRKAVDLEKYPIKVGDYVKVKLSGLGSDSYRIEEIHSKENKKGEMEVYNYTVVLDEVGTNGRYQHRIGENGTMFATGKPGLRTNLKRRITKI